MIQIKSLYDDAPYCTCCRKRIKGTMELCISDGGRGAFRMNLCTNCRQELYVMMKATLPPVQPKGTKLSTVCLLCKKPAVTFNTEDDIPYTNYSYCEDCLRKGLKLLKKQINALPPVQPDVPDTNVGDMISRQAAIDAVKDAVIKDEQQYAEDALKALPPVQPKNGTLIIPLNESDFKSVKRIMLDNKPWCRMFYEDAPGEAHWIKNKDGNYECDNCGVVWAFNDGGPEENEAYFCPKCGFEMMPKEGEGNGQN